MPPPSTRLNPAKARQTLRLVVVLVLAGLASYSAWQKNRGLPERPGDLPIEVDRPTNNVEREEEAAQRESSRTTIPNQTIRQQDGEIVFRGDVDVGQTLSRIRRSERLNFPNDGTIFQNRERRLPQKPRGYYREYVHPTPSLAGPGPQRIVQGDGGETYYTPDHYRTFKRLDHE